MDTLSLKAVPTLVTGATWLEKRFHGRMPFNREDLRKLTEDAWFSSDRIRTELGFGPRHDLEAEIPLMVKEYLGRGR